MCGGWASTRPAQLKHEKPCVLVECVLLVSTLGVCCGFLDWQLALLAQEFNVVCGGWVSTLSVQSGLSTLSLSNGSLTHPQRKNQISFALAGCLLLVPTLALDSGCLDWQLDPPCVRIKYHVWWLGVSSGCPLWVSGVAT